MTRSPYFFYGSALDQPVESSGRLQQFALYSPVPGRFCLAYHDREILKEVAKLFSSRYNLRLCRLDSAGNFRPNLIDNEVCFHWSPESSQGMGFTRFISPDDFLYDVKKLKYYEDCPTDELIYQDREYFWAAVNWISFFNQSCFDPFYKPWVEDMRSYIDFPLPTHPLHKLKTEIFSVIYHEFDFVAAEYAIKQLLEKVDYCDFKEINLRFNNWL